MGWIQWAFEEVEGLSHAAAHELVTWAVECVKRRGRFVWASCGGRSPRRLYEVLCQEPYRSRMPWARTHFFFTDERCVAPNHPWSNFRVINELMLQKVPVIKGHVHRIEGELRDPEEAATRYHRQMGAFFGSESPGEKGTGPDLVLLGLGADGHIASLFPRHPALEVDDRWAAGVRPAIGDPPVERVTLTLPAINRGWRVWVFSVGKEKLSVARLILNDPEGCRGEYPAANIDTSAEVLWFLQG